MEKCVFYAVLNLGLGHATRSLPLMREFSRRGWRLVVGSNGRALELLKGELPEAIFVQTPSYNLTYARNNHTGIKLFFQAPKIVKGIAAETAFCEEIVSRFKPGLIMSDQCYGIYHPQVLSYVISHQIFFEMPRGAKMLRGAIRRMNTHFYEKFSRVIIPDFAGAHGGLLSGRLSELPENRRKYYYGGLLSSIRKQDVVADIDLLVSISGPEPQRSIFQEKVLKDIDRIPGKKVVLLGKSESTELLAQTDTLTVFSHQPRSAMANLINRARLIVTRSGYSTLMELAELGKPALLVPTPGQTEQVYLAQRAMAKRWYYTVSQENLSLHRDVQRARDYVGIFKPNVTHWAVAEIFKHLIDPFQSAS